ncbi:MAG: mechanosensitive ion channel family protein [Deltaproteobacteria bacterium]|nr:mechanosensitive ion channel family protein [Deltaproteobacteria bacterium]NND30515.1 mechanosensitive ion channel family protein [Myxococcales bacterium]MBT8465667.1 mechanosensitive ion channel family protein [Deltaproteobacteria bacterium]MBT8482315.1 mechanosensitive ion channel family protein [Deltaproteobacteria bacterium]NNK09266.1 mechanosensitive ion channel family protein [Myxococcales bacterium]
MFELTDTVFGNELRRWLIALAVTVGVLIVLRLVEQVLIVRVQRLASKTATMADDIVIGGLRKTKLLYLLIVSLFAGSLSLELDAEVRSIILQTAVIATLVQAGIWISTGLQIWLEHYRKTEEDGANRTTMNALSFVGRLALWVIVFLLVIDNLGVDVTALVAGMGIGGIAIALAVQNILGDLFASLSIVLDKPFVNGDFIVVGDLAGAVEHVGIKTTRVRSLSGEQLVFSNSDLLQSRVRNFGRMQQRRVVFSLGVTYQTPADKLERIPSLIQSAVEAQDFVRFDRSHFATYGDFALGFETVYYVESSDYTQHMDILQAINLRIYRTFEDEGIEFAYPTQTLFVAKE